MAHTLATLLSLRTASISADEAIIHEKKESHDIACVVGVVWARITLCRDDDDDSGAHIAVKCGVKQSCTKEDPYKMTVHSTNPFSVWRGHPWCGWGRFGADLSVSLLTRSFECDA